MLCLQAWLHAHIVLYLFDCKMKGAWFLMTKTNRRKLKYYFLSLPSTSKESWAIGNDIAIVLESFNKKSIDGAVPAFLAELACGGL